MSGLSNEIDKQLGWLTGAMKRLVDGEPESRPDEGEKAAKKVVDLLEKIPIGESKEIMDLVDRFGGKKVFRKIIQKNFNASNAEDIALHPTHSSKLEYMWKLKDSKCIAKSSWDAYLDGLDQREEEDSERRRKDEAAATPPPRCFKAEVVNCFNPNGGEWQLICTGGEKSGIRKGMKAVVNFDPGTVGQSCRGKVAEVYATRCKLIVEAPSDVGDGGYDSSYFESVQIGKKARAKFKPPGAGADADEAEEGGALSPLDAAKEVLKEIRKIKGANQGRIEELVPMYARNKAFRTYLRKKINSKLATRLGEELYMGEGSHIDTIYNHKCMTKRAWKAFIKPQQDAAGR
jgi:hypothetical protein